MKTKCLICGGTSQLLGANLECTVCGSVVPLSTYSQYKFLKEKTFHQTLVETFMRGAKQEVPNSPTIPCFHVRKLRAKLIVEEALETLRALGFLYDQDNQDVIEVGSPDLVEVVDGCADTKVVLTGTLSAFGVKDRNPQYLVDINNLDKLTTGTLREDGKLIKSKEHVPPNLKDEIFRQINLRDED